MEIQFNFDHTDELTASSDGAKTKVGSCHLKTTQASKIS